MVYRTLLRSKIHRAVVTTADIDYVGSLTIDKELMEAADLVEYEHIHIANVDNGARLETYVIEGPRGSGIIGANGAAARLVNIGDRIIIMSYSIVEEPIPVDWKPKILILNEKNEIIG